MGFYSFFGVGKPFDPELRLVTSYVISPSALLFLRALFALYSLVSLIVNVIYASVVLDTGDAWPTYFTNLSYVGLCAYFCAATVQSWSYVQSLKRRSPEHGYALQRWHPFLQFSHIVLFSTIAVCPIIVVIVLWALIRPDDAFSSSYRAWNNITVHILNGVFALLELLLGRCTLYWSHLIWVQLIGWSYLALAYVVHETQGFYPYSFLDPSKGRGRLVAYIFGIFAAFCVIFVLAWFICWVRDRIFKGKVKTGETSKAQDLEKTSNMEPVRSR